MNSLDTAYIVGIDLGTTNSAVSYVDLRTQSPSKTLPRIFKIPQITAEGEFSRLPILPSFLYIPGEYDVSDFAVRLPWKQDEKYFVGAFARDHGAKVPARLVSSAKSWLCHARVDRHAPILPWGATGQILKISPVQATAAYLNHIRKTWNHAHAGDSDLHLEYQMVILTVPASFDEVARGLTLEAATLAGLKNITLLEEPVAAFYSWLTRHEKEWQSAVVPGELILICDVGGGTTDFTLITLKEVQGSPRFERIAVGDHLILGGDNIDLALARRLEADLGRRQISLSGDRWKTLCHQCRQAKETILDGDDDHYNITLMGSGSSLISGTVSARLDRRDVEETVLEGFFPADREGYSGAPAARKGITELGLPYEQQPAITHHLNRFLDQHRHEVEALKGRSGHAPDLILFNGGSLKPTLIQERIRSAIRHRFNIKDQSLPRILENDDPNVAVAMGAAYYGMVKKGRGVKVGSGSARAYYLGVQTQSSDSSGKAGRHAICLIERGLEEGSHIELGQHTFEVLANQPVSFDIFSTSYRSGDCLGDVIEVDDSLSSLPPIRTMVEFGKKGSVTRIPVRIEASFTEMGTLSLWCSSLSSSHRWQLQFQLRDAPLPQGVAEERVLEAGIVAQVSDIMQNAFLQTSGHNRLDSAMKEMEQTAGLSRKIWPLGLLRQLADNLLQNDKWRSSSQHEGRWLNLVGFTLRPGFGDNFDPQRMQKLLKVYRQGALFSKNSQVRCEWWIMWRRVAGGLKPGQQRQFMQDISSLLLPRGKAKVRISFQERLEMWAAVANMELLMAKDKIKWGRQLLSELAPRKSKSQHFWALARIGARQLLYGPDDRVVPATEIASWIKALLDQKWRNPQPVAVALLQLARRTGDRTRDLDEKLIETVLQWIAAAERVKLSTEPLKTVVPLAPTEQNCMFGEELPAGLILRSAKEAGEK